MLRKPLIVVEGRYFRVIF